MDYRYTLTVVVGLLLAVAIVSVGLVGVLV